MNSRGAATLSSLVAELGNNVTAVSLDDVLRADVIILAVPFMAHPAIAAAMTDRAGKTIFDAMNTYGVPPDLLAGRASSEVAGKLRVKSGCVTKQAQACMLYQRWESASRNRLAEAGFKPPSVAAFKRRGRERLWKRRR